MWSQQGVVSFKKIIPLQGFLRVVVLVRLKQAMNFALPKKGNLDGYGNEDGDGVHDNLPVLGL
ncbi:MAG: hypothetical protein M0P69_12155 [Bacteroidales bacterium]|nr:hypothetical protein [Bacteroidales bacterium]